jgi:hypothetical protein
MTLITLVPLTWNYIQMRHQQSVTVVTLRENGFALQRESLISFVTPGTCSERKHKLCLHAYHIRIRISRIIYKHFVRPLFAIYTENSLYRNARRSIKKIEKFIFITHWFPVYIWFQYDYIYLLIPKS